MATRRLDPGKTTAAARSFAGLAQELGETEAVAHVEDALARTESGLFRLVVAGEVKKGKSSLVNTLLGAPDLLPTGDDVATSTVFKVVHGAERRYRAFFRDLEDPEAELEPRDITLEEAVALGTEDGRANGAGDGESPKPRLDFIAVALPHPLLADGLTIIDTPGLGALFRQHAAITWRYVPNADAVLFVVDSQEALISADEAKAVARLREITSDILFVQTKTDLAPDTWQGWRDRNLEILSQTLTMSPESLPYFPVSAALEAAGQRQASGFAPLRSHLEADLLGGKRERLAGGLMTVVAREAAHLRRRLAEELQVLESSSAEELRNLSEAAQAARGQFETWHSTDFREAMESFRYDLTALSQSFTHRCQNEIDASPHGVLINEIIERMREAAVPARQIVRRWPEIAGEVADRCAQRGLRYRAGLRTTFRQADGGHWGAARAIGCCHGEQHRPRDRRTDGSDQHRAASPEFASVGDPDQGPAGALQSLRGAAWHRVRQHTGLGRDRSRRRCRRDDFSAAFAVSDAGCPGRLGCWRMARLERGGRPQA